MHTKGNFMIDLSVLYRNTQKFFDHVLEQYQIGWGQLIYLFVVYENEGVTMQEAARIGEVDKGTTTKSIQKLVDQGYMTVRQDENDKRVKRLFTTEKATGIINDLYEYRNLYRKNVFSEIDGDRFEKMLEKACENSRSAAESEKQESVRLGGLQKMTLLDYPGYAACTIFTSGCNFKCPFCHNRDLVFVPDDYEYQSEEELFSFLNKRRGILDGVCISGGEPLLQKGLLSLIQKIKDMGYRVKLDTNGYAYDILKEVLDTGLVDYVAMDLKNCREKYTMTCGLKEEVFHYDDIEKCVNLLLEGKVAYEFRTTVVKEFHTAEDLVKIAERIRGAQHYYLQQFHPGDQVIQSGLSAYSRAEMEELLKAVQTVLPQSELRGVKEV